MNKKDIKLALSIDLVNQAPQEEILMSIYLLVDRFKSFLGKLNDVKELDKRKFTRHIRTHYALHYDNARIDIDLLTNPLTKTQSVYSFDIVN
ncbi:MAG: hypothetical protein HKN16_01745 [Saprospiraceae bacterium]|nr:hypothetical protein [Saprospiraceae bacterium]